MHSGSLRMEERNRSLVMKGEEDSRVQAQWVSSDLIVTVVTAQLISAIVFATQIVQFYFLNLKLLACFCTCTARFVLDLFENHIVGFPMTWLILFITQTCL